MRTHRTGAVLALTGLLTGAGLLAARTGAESVNEDGIVTIRRVPNGGLQPEAARDASGTLHLLYFAGAPADGDLFYVRSSDEGATFTAPIQVNSQPGSAVAAGTIRGGQLAVGANGRVHVAWNGSAKALPKGQFFHARLNDGGTAFEPQRGLMQRSDTLDGGGSIAADENGNVYAVWHGNDARTGNDGEARRRVWVARSSDAGRTFDPEAPAWDAPTGACGCCGMRALSRGRALYVVYRSATASMNRDIFALVSSDGAKTFAGSRVHEWDINACPMTSMSLASTKSGVVAAWETEGLVYFGALDARGNAASHTAPPGETKGRKHPRLAANASGQMLVVWTEGTSHTKGGSLAWQVFDGRSRPASTAGRLDGVPAFSFGAAVPRRDGGFTVFY
jgi:hypothetical protein